MKTRNSIFAATVIVAALAAAGTAMAHPGMGRGMGMGPGMGAGPGNCMAQGAGPGASGAAGTCQGMGPGQGMGMGPGMGQAMGRGMGPGMGMRGMPGADTAVAAATRLADLKTSLKITAEQEAAWGQFAAVATRHAEARANMRTQMQARMNDPKATAPDRAAWQETMAKFRLEMQTGRTAALKDLYAVLTPEQKALADQNMPGMQGQRMAGRMGGQMGGPMGGHMGRHGGWGMGR